MPTALIVSCGVTDLQVKVALSDGHSVQAEIGGAAPRDFHEALLDGRIAYRVDAEKVAPQADRRYVVEWRDAPWFKDGETRKAWPLPGEIVLVPAKLAAIARQLGDKDVRAAIVFGTRRDSRKGEPIAAAPVLSAWLAATFNLRPGQCDGDIGEGRSGWVDCLIGQERAEGTDGEPVNRIAVQRIDDALRRLGDGFEQVYLSVGGGIPEFRDQIRAAVRFRFPRAQRHDRLHAEGAEWVDSDRLMASPADSFRARAEARTLVQAGDFAGAFAVAQWLRTRASEKGWTDVLRIAAHFFDGRLLNRATVPAVLAGLVDPGLPRCLLAALRTEAALRSDRWPEAVLWTCAFRDAALMDHIRRQPFVEEVNEWLRQLTCRPDIAPDGRLFNGDPRDRCLKQVGARVYEYNTRVRVVDAWFTVTGAASLRQFDGLLRTGGRVLGGASPNGVRDLLMHSGLPESEMAQVRSLFVEADLWASRKISGCCFLDRPSVVAVLAELDVNDPGKYYDEMVSGVVQALENHRLTA